MAPIFFVPDFIQLPGLSTMDSENDYNGTGLVVVSVVFLVLTYLAVFSRCFVRILITKAFQTDDWFVLLSQVMPYRMFKLSSA